MRRARAVYLDNMTAPVLTVPFAAGTILRPRSLAYGAVWLGLTAASGDAWQAVDIVSWQASGAAITS